MSATVAQLVEIRSSLAESIGQYYKAVIANLDRTPWSHHASQVKIPASQVAIPALVIRQITEGERRERKGREDDERRRMDREVAVFYEEPCLENDRVEVAWARERRNLTRAVLKGAPGGGKTFLTQTTALDLAREGQQQLDSKSKELNHMPLPVMVELKKLQGDKLPRHLSAALIEILAEHYPVRGPLESWFTMMLQTSNCWLILDGLDEVDSKHRQHVNDRLAAIETAKWECRVLLTCRTANFADGYVPWRKLVTYELTPLEPSTIGKLIGRFYGEGDERGIRLREIVAGSYSLQHACRSSLLAALACVAHEECPLTGDATRRDLYQRVVDSVLRRRWKGAGEEAPGNLSVDDLKIVLRPTAWRLFASSPAVNQFSNEQVTDVIAEANRGGRVALSAAAIRDTLVESGILVAAGKNDDGDEQLSFMHRTMLEFLAGEHLGRAVKKGGWDRALVEWGDQQRVPVSLLVEKKGWLPEWRETLVLLAVSLGDSGLVERIIELLMGKEDDLYGHRLGLAAVALAEQPVEIQKKLNRSVDVVTCGGYELFWRNLERGSGWVVEHFLPAWKSVGKLNGRLADGRTVLATTMQAVMASVRHVRSVSKYAHFAWGSIGESAARPEVLAALVRALEGDAEPSVRHDAVSALGRLGEAGARPEVLAALVRALDGDAEPSNRRDAASVLGRLGDAGARPEVLAALMRALKSDAEPLVRRDAASALANMGEAGARPEVLAALVRALEGNADPSVRGHAAWLLAHILEGGRSLTQLTVVPEKFPSGFASR